MVILVSDNYGNVITRLTVGRVTPEQADDIDREDLYDIEVLGQVKPSDLEDIASAINREFSRIAATQ